MFKWFRGSSSKPRHTDVILATSAEKWAALPALVAAQPSTSVYGWFDATLAQAETVLADSGVRVQHGREFVAASAHGQHIVLLEHYPLCVR